MITVFTILFILWFVICWKHIDKLGAGLIGMHEDRYGMFNLDVMIPSWLAVGSLYLLVWLVF